MSYPTKQLVELGTSLVEEAEHRGALLRLLGGLAYYLNSPRAVALPELQREYKDLDFVVNPRGVRVLNEVFQNQGWTDDHYFNAVHGATRMLFYYKETLQADVFVGVFEQCHKIDFKDRLAHSKPTIPLAELLLTKLQIHQLNKKDIQDVVTLLYDHDFGQSTTMELPELKSITNITSDDWGWYTTVYDNLVAIEPMVNDFLKLNDLIRVKSNLIWIRQSMENTPKSLRWKMRDRVGRRMKWYEEPEEVNR